MNTPSLVSAHIIFDIGGVLFKDIDFSSSALLGPDKPFITYQPIAQGISLLHECASKKDERGKRLHNLFVLSNTKKTPTMLLERFPTIYTLFDGIITAATSPYSKPDIRAYHHVITTYRLEPAQCIFIDDNPTNIAAAEQCGMRALLCTDFEQVMQELKKMNVL